MKLAVYLFTGVLLLKGFIQPIHKPAVHVVKMEGMRFIPKVIEINAGETVRWVNESSSAHNVVAADKRFKSKMLSSAADQFEYTFTTAGEYRYFCEPHKMMGMIGVVVVKE